jgi:sugar/nucleoside kinase (ribokinase family)
MFDIITIGSVTFDNFLEIEAPKIFWDKVPSKKALALALGQKLEIKNIYQCLGGNSSNASVTFARQGFKTACAAKVGSDIYGQFILKKLQEEKVNTNFLKIDKKRHTAYSTILLQSGERVILGYHGASNYFNLNDLKLSQMKSPWWYLSLPGESYKIFNDLINFAYKNQIAVAFNPSGYHLKKDRNSILKNLNKIAVLLLNEEEASTLIGISWKKEKAMFLKLDKLMPKILVVTSGKEGAMVSDNNYIYYSGIFKEKRLVDRTGAGDAFGAGFVSGLMHNGIKFKNILNIKSDIIKNALRLACANSTSVVENIGATSGVLKKQQFLNNSRFKNLNIKIQKI